MARKYDEHAPSPFRLRGTKKVLSNEELHAFETKWANRPRQVPEWLREHPYIIGGLLSGIGVIVALHWFFSTVHLLSAIDMTNPISALASASIFNPELWLAIATLCIGDVLLMVSGASWKLFSLLGYDTRDFFDMVESTDEARRKSGFVESKNMTEARRE